MKAGGTWALKFPPPQKIELTAVVKGTCWVAVDGERAPVRLETGDVFVVPAERSYVLASDLKASQTDGLALFTRATDNERQDVCQGVAFHRHAMAQMPRTIKAPVRLAGPDGSACDTVEISEKGLV